MRRPGVGRCHCAITVTATFLVTFVVIAVITDVTDAKRDPQPWLGFVERKAKSVWKWGTVLALYGTVGAWEREVKNPRLIKMYSSRWLYRATFRPEVKFLSDNRTNTSLGRINLRKPHKHFADREKLTMKDIEEEFYRQYTKDSKDAQAEVMYQKLIDMMNEHKNETIEKLTGAKSNQTQEFKETFKKYLNQSAARVDTETIKQIFRDTWYMFPQEPLYKQVPGKMWRNEPKTRDVGNPNYNHQRKEIRRIDRRQNKNQGQKWRLQKQKRERIKQKILDARRATMKQRRRQRASYRKWLLEPEASYSLDEYLICKKNKDKFQDWDTYKVILKERLKKEKKEKKKRIKLWKEAQEKLLTTTTAAPARTTRTFRRYTRRSKDPYTGTRIIGKKERLMLRKERRRIKNRTKRLRRLLERTNMTTVAKHRKAAQRQRDFLDKMAEEAYKANMEAVARYREQEEKQLKEEALKATVATVAPKTLATPSLTPQTTATILSTILSTATTTTSKPTPTSTEPTSITMKTTIKTTKGTTVEETTEDLLWMPPELKAAMSDFGGKK